MKSLKDYSLNITEEEYHAYPAWSHSILSRYAKDGFASLATLHEPVAVTSSMEFGSLVDCMLTHGNEAEAEYSVMDVTVPDAEKKALDYIASVSTLPFEKMSVDYIYDLTNECGYQSRLKPDTKYEKLKPYADYYNAKHDGKKIVSKKDWDDAAQIRDIFHSHPLLKELFGTESTSDIEYIYQAKYVVKYRTDDGKDIKVKIMPDLLVVNHKEKTIQPVDLKTSAAPAWNFKENFLKYRYDYQAAMYTDVLNVIKNKAEGYADYSVLPFIFTDISRSDMTPVAWVYDPNDESQVMGLAFGNYQYKNYRQTLNEIISYEEAQAKVPSYVDPNGLNDILAVLNRQV